MQDKVLGTVEANPWRNVLNNRLTLLSRDDAGQQGYTWREQLDRLDEVNVLQVHRQVEILAFLHGRIHGR